MKNDNVLTREQEFAGEVEDMSGERHIFLTAAVMLPLNVAENGDLLIAQKNYFIDVRALDLMGEALDLTAERAITDKDEISLPPLLEGAGFLRLAEVLAAHIDKGEIVLDIDNEKCEASGYDVQANSESIMYFTGSSNLANATPSSLRAIHTAEELRQAIGTIDSYKDKIITAEDGKCVPVCVVAHLEDLPEYGMEAMNDITCVDTAFDMTRISKTLSKDEILNIWFLKPED